MAFSPDGARLAAGSADRTVIIWDVATGQKQLTCRGHIHHNITTLAFSYDGRRLASGCQDRTIRIWDTATGKETLPPLRGHESTVFRVAFSLDRQRLASCSNGGVTIWEATTGEEILSLTGHPGGVSHVVFSPDGHRLISAGEHGLMVWDAAPLTPETALEREALGLLASLFAKPLRQEDVKEFLNNSPTITPAVRQLALSLVGRYHEETQPEAYYQASWAVARQRYLNAFQYHFALQQAQTACQKAPDQVAYQTTLGVAQYRSGQFQEALATLTKANFNHELTPVGLAFLAMTQHRLGRTEEAHSSLDQLRQMMRNLSGETSREAADFLRDAETVLAGQ
jgi:hypothetical protein